MANPIFQQGSGQGPVQGGNPQNVMQQVQQFANGLRGDPQQIVQQLRASGQMSQQQFDGLMQQARQIAAMLGNR